MSNALHSVAITGVFNTEQSRALHRSTRDVMNEAALGAIADAGLQVGDIDGIVSTNTHELVFDLGVSNVRTMPSGPDIEGVLEAAGLLVTGQATAVLLAAAKATTFDRSSVAPWVRPANEFVVSHGLITLTCLRCDGVSANT